MPLVEVRDLLIFDVVVDLETLDACLLHEVLNNWCNDFLVDLVNAERYVASVSIL